MSIDLASISYPLPSVPLSAQSAGVPQIVYVGQNLTNGWIRFQNESPFLQNIVTGAGGNPKIITAQYEDIFQLPPGDKLFTFTPSGLISGAAPSYQVNSFVYPYAKPPGAFPAPLPRQTSPTTAATIAGFVGYFPFSVSSSSDVLCLNLYNPSTTKHAFIYSARFVMNGGAATTTVQLGARTNLADFNLGTAVTPYSNQAQGVNAVSAMHLTASVSATSVTGNILYDQQEGFQSGLPIEMLLNNDIKEIFPGSQIFFLAAGLPSTAVSGSFRFAYYEQ